MKNVVLKKLSFTKDVGILALVGAAMLLGANAFADAKWSYDTATWYLTSLTAGDGGTPSKYVLTPSGLLGGTGTEGHNACVVGTETVLDFREEAMPDNAPKILSINTGIWKKNTVVQEIYLPNTVRILGSSLIHSASNLVHIEPFVPESVTNVAAGAFEWNSSLTNDFRVGFAKDENEDGKYLETTLGSKMFWSTPGVKKVMLGPGIKKIPAEFTYGASAVASIEFGENIEEVGDSFTAFKKTLTNVVFKTKGVFPFPSGTSMFNGCTLVQEVTWNGWCEHPSTTNPFNGWGALQCRFIIPGDNLKWAVFCANTNNVTPWSACEEADKTAYYEKYGESAKEPVGISVANAASFPRTYIVTDGKTLQGAIVDVTAPNAAFGTVTMTTPQNTDGTYTSGSAVTITWKNAEGVEFTGWTGDVAEADKMKETIEVTAENVKSVKPTFKAPFWVYEKGELTDGEWVLEASGAADAITVVKAKSYQTTLVSSLKNGEKIDAKLDLRKEVKNGTIMAMNAFSRVSAGKELLLPDTVTRLKCRAFLSQESWELKRTRIWPLVATNVTFVGAQAFDGQNAMTGDVAVGFATNAAGASVETELNSSGQQFRNCNGIGPSVSIGPGVYSIPSQAFMSAASGYGDGMVEVWMGANVTNAAAAAFYNFHGNKKTTFHMACDMFPGSSAMFYNGANTTATNYTVRVMIEGASAKTEKWREYVANTSYVTPWASLTDEQKQLYWTNFPQETFGVKHPTGLTIAVKDTTGLPPNQWVFLPASKGLMLIIR